MQYLCGTGMCMQQRWLLHVGLPVGDGKHQRHARLSKLAWRAEAQRECNAAVGRYWKIKNPGSTHPATGELLTYRVCAWWLLPAAPEPRHGTAQQMAVSMCPSHDRPEFAAHQLNWPSCPAFPSLHPLCRQASGVQAGAHPQPAAAGGAQQQHRQARRVCHKAPVGHATRGRW